MTRPEEFRRSSARTAREIVDRLGQGDAARERIRPEWTPGHYFAQLLDKQEDVAAVPFLAHALPKREAVWWACLCARQSAGTASPAAAALECAERWVADPTEENRQSGMAAALAAGLISPAACASLAAFVSGGSLASAGVPPVPADENATSQTVTGAVLLAAAAEGEQNMAGRLRACLALGLDVACGRRLWNERR